MLNKYIKNNVLGISIATLFALTGSIALADLAGDIQSEFMELEKAGSTDGQAWFALAQKARQPELLEIAAQALDRAESNGVSPIRIAMERSRQHIVADSEEQAVTELRGVFEQGFTGVGFLTSDPVINSLAGNAGYDALIEEMSVQAYPCASTPGFSDFDFWIGDWDVHIANGTPAGTNSITREERGCVLVERWRNTSGGTGMSINYLDMTTNEWVQVWNAEGGTQIYVRGGLTDEGMSMEGTIHYVNNGTTAPFRALWSPLPDGRVRQYFEQSNDGGETWVPWFEGFYTRSDP